MWGAVRKTMARVVLATALLATGCRGDLLPYPASSARVGDPCEAGGCDCRTDAGRALPPTGAGALLLLGLLWLRRR